jgi:hypothetical protein
MKEIVDQNLILMMNIFNPNHRILASDAAATSVENCKYIFFLLLNLFFLINTSFYIRIRSDLNTGNDNLKSCCLL